jgi:GDP-D-mannose dehydratase
MTPEEAEKYCHENGIFDDNLLTTEVQFSYDEPWESTEVNWTGIAKLIDTVRAEKERT